jgi:hypothetical protein
MTPNSWKMKFKYKALINRNIKNIQNVRIYRQAEFEGDK